MSYVENSLANDETIKLQAKVSWFSQAFLVLLSLCLIPFMGVGLLLLFCLWLKIRGTEFAATDRRIIAKTGVIARRTYEINIRKVESIQVDQGIFGRLFNYGTILVSGTGTTTARIPAIDEPMIFRRRLQDIVDQVQQQANPVNSSAGQSNMGNVHTIVVR